MENNDNKKLKLIIVAVISIIVILFILLIVERVRYQNSIPLTSKVKLVKDYSKFFTVDDCVNKYLNYISNNDKEDLIKILNSNYAKEKDIDVNNVIKKLDIYDISNKLTSYKTTAVYEEKKEDNKYSYYVIGELYEEVMDEVGSSKEYYFIVNIDYDTLLFDVMYYDGSLFKEIKK